MWRGYESYVVGLGVSLFPLDKDQLGDNQGDNQNQHHLCMHGLMPLVFGMHPGMLHPMDTDMRWLARLGERLKSIMMPLDYIVTDSFQMNELCN